MPNHPRLGELVKNARRSAGLTQEALADRAGLSTRAISDMERNVNHAPRPGTVQLLIRALSLSAQERAHFEAAVRAAQANSSSTAQSAVSAERDPSTQSAEQAGAPTSASRPPLIGRTAELAVIDRHLAGGCAPLLVVSGEPGIGKTRVLQEAAALAATRGLSVFRGTVAAPGQHDQSNPIVDALRHWIEHRSPMLLRQDLLGCAWLVRALPELAAGPIEPLPASSVDADQEGTLTARAIARFLANTAGPAGTLITLDNLHAADAAALTDLATLVHQSRDAPLRIIGAYRDGALARGDALSSMLAELAHEQLVHHVSLTPLPTNEASELVLALVKSRHVAVRLLERVVHQSGGVPFYLVAWAQDIQQLPSEPSADQIPWSIEQSVRARITAAAPAARAVLEAIAVAGGRITYPALVAVAGVTEDDLLAALDGAARHRLVDERGHAYTFAYDAIRSVVEADISSSRRRRLQKRLSSVISRPRTGVRMSTIADERAYHLGVLRQHRA